MTGIDEERVRLIGGIDSVLQESERDKRVEGRDLAGGEAKAAQFSVRKNVLDFKAQCHGRTFLRRKGRVARKIGNAWHSNDDRFASAGLKLICQTDVDPNGIVRKRARRKFVGEFEETLVNT